MNIQIKNSTRKKRKQQFQNLFLLIHLHNFWDFIIHVIICIMLVDFYSYCLITISYKKYHIATHILHSHKRISYTTGLQMSPSAREKLIWYFDKVTLSFNNTSILPMQNICTKHVLFQIVSITFKYCANSLVDTYLDFRPKDETKILKIAHHRNH